MGMWIGRNRKARVTYGFDEIALVPGRVTINPNEVDIRFRLPRKEAEPLELKIPILASAMDGVVDVRFAIAMNKLGGLAVLNLEGVQTRYKNPQEVLQKIVDANKSDITALLQRIYQEPVQEDLIAARVRQIKDGGVLAAVSSIPQRAAEFGRIAQEAGADVHCWKHRRLRCDSRYHGVRAGRGFGRCWTGSGLHFARRAWTWCSAGDRHSRLRGGARRLLQEIISLRPNHH